jgi:hypothetical protein
MKSLLPGFDQQYRCGSACQKQKLNDKKSEVGTILK